MKTRKEMDGGLALRALFFFFFDFVWCMYSFCAEIFLSKNSGKKKKRAETRENEQKLSNVFHP